MNLKITEKMTPTQMRQLIKHSNFDEIIIKSTNDRERFSDQASVDKWLKKKRKFYILIDEEDKLMGIIWFGKETIPTKDKKYSITFAIRLYEGNRGKGYAKKFMKEAITKFKLTSEYKKRTGGFWLITNPDNLPAIKAYEYFGFKKIPYEDSEGRILMATKDL